MTAAVDGGDQQRLARLADALRVSKAEAIRRALRAYEPAPAAVRSFRLASSFDGPGDSMADQPRATLLAASGVWWDLILQGLPA